jgi:diguanylate cyclase (GGDEF)-like protein
VLAGFGIVLALALSWLLGRQLVRRLRVLAALARETAAGDLTARFPTTGDDEVAQLGIAFNEMADELAGLVRRMEMQAAHDSFGSQLIDALEMADEEGEAYAVIERAMAEVAPEAPTELLLADSSHAHLERVVMNGVAGGPGCPVDSPYACMAVRRGRAVVFENSEALNACSKLRGRPTGPCSAVCVPVTFMGKALGVLHQTGPAGTPAPNARVDRLTTLAAQSGSRIGTVRAFQQSQLQATTDGLTGLINRRTLENDLRSMLQDSQQFALAMADLDHFKKLNDTFGHEGGDRALRLFARTVRDAVRVGDKVARYGGEEFVFVLPGATADAAADMLDRLRVVLSGAIAGSGVPVFTVSFGVTDSRMGRTLDELVRCADEALMVAKARGRDQVVVYESAMSGAPATANGGAVKAAR